MLEKVFNALQEQHAIQIKIEGLCLDSTAVKVHPDGTGALKKRPTSIGKSRAEWTTKIHLVSATDHCAVSFSLSPGNAHDAPEGRKLMGSLPG